MKKKNHQILKELSGAKLNETFILRNIKLFRDSGDVKRRKGSGRKRSVRTSALVKVVNERIRRNPEHSVRKLDQHLEISETSALRIIHES